MEATRVALGVDGAPAAGRIRTMDGVIGERTQAEGATAWEALYRSDYAQLVRLAGLLVGDFGLGEEITQEAFARLLESRTEIADPASYVRGIVANLCRSRIRRSLLARRHPDPDPDVPTGWDEGGVDGGARIVISGALKRLPRRQREAIVLRFYGGMTESEIAVAMGVSIGAVKTHLHRAHAALSEALEGIQ
jgi:RNA polymerase sigma factor (sigma-70 family)